MTTSNTLKNNNETPNQQTTKHQWREVQISKAVCVFSGFGWRMILEGLQGTNSLIYWLYYNLGAIIPKVLPLTLKSLGCSDSQRNTTVNMFTTTLLLIILFLSNSIWDLITGSPKSVLVFWGFPHRLLLGPEMPIFSINKCILFFHFKDPTRKLPPLLIIQFL